METIFLKKIEKHLLNVNNDNYHLLLFQGPHVGKTNRQNTKKKVAAMVKAKVRKCFYDIDC